MRFVRILLPCAFALMATAASATQEAPVLAINLPTIQLTNIRVVNEGGGMKTVDIPWIAQYVTGVYSYAVAIAAILAGVMFVIGGFQYLTAGGDSNRVKAAKTRITDSVVGMLLVFGAYVVLNTINPQLVSNPDIRIQTVKKVRFISNETPPSEIDSTGGAPAPGAPDGPLTPVPFRHFAQCGPVGGRTPYLAQGGRCTRQSDGTPYTLCSSGCGVASATMAIAALTGRDVNQLAGELAGLSSTNGCRPCNADCSICFGTAEGCLVGPNVIGRYGLSGGAVTGRTAVLAQLNAGHPVVALYGSSMFCAARPCGHYVLLAGVNPDGTIRVFDPGKNQNPYNYDCTKVRFSSATATCPISSDHVPADVVFGSGLGGTWYIRPNQ